MEEKNPQLENLIDKIRDEFEYLRERVEETYWQIDDLGVAINVL